MPKRKQDTSSEEESHHEDSFHSDCEDAPVSNKKPSKNTAKKASGSSSKKPKVDANKEPIAEKQSPVAADKDNNGVNVLADADGEKYIDLGKKKRAVVRSFKGTALLDIREYYGMPGEEKPGKKGISLTLDQWKILSAEATTINKLFSEQKKA